MPTLPTIYFDTSSYVDLARLDDAQAKNWETGRLAVRTERDPQSWPGSGTDEFYELGTLDTSPRLPDDESEQTLLHWRKESIRYPGLDRS